MDAEEIAEKLGKDIKTITEIINLGKEKLLKERNKRELPLIDRTLYTSLNGMLISTYLRAFRVLKDKSLKDFAQDGEPVEPYISRIPVPMFRNCRGLQYSCKLVAE